MQLLEIPLVSGVLFWEKLERMLADEFTVVKMPRDGMCGWASVLYNMGSVNLVHVDGTFVVR